jgi:hypothetical protein
MNREDIIRMADEAKLIAVMEMFEEEVVRFAELVRQHTQIKQMLKFEELANILREKQEPVVYLDEEQRVAYRVARAAAAEREACARVCEELAALNRSSPTDSMWQWGECAAAIRARK